MGTLISQKVVNGVTVNVYFEDGGLAYKFLKDGVEYVIEKDLDIPAIDMVDIQCAVNTVEDESFMTVGMLKELLNELPDDTLVMVSDNYTDTPGRAIKVGQFSATYLGGTKAEYGVVNYGLADITTNADVEEAIDMIKEVKNVNAGRTLAIVIE